MPVGHEVSIAAEGGAWGLDIGKRHAAQDRQEGQRGDLNEKAKGGVRGGWSRRNLRRPNWAILKQFPKDPLTNLPARIMQFKWASRSCELTHSRIPEVQYGVAGLSPWLQGLPILGVNVQTNIQRANH